MLLPTATPRLKVNLSLTDTVTAVVCSAALPTIGSRIKPINSFEIPLPLANPPIESTSHSAVTATRAVTTTRRPRVIGRDNSGISSSSFLSLMSIPPRCSSSQSWWGGEGVSLSTNPGTISSPASFTTISPNFFVFSFAPDLVRETYRTVSGFGPVLSSYRFLWEKSWKKRYAM